jgi:hypothetical protein
LSAGSLFAFFVRSLLAVLLLAWPLAAERIRADGSVTDHAFTILGLDPEQMVADAIAPQGDPERLDGDRGPAWLALAAGTDDLILDQARLVRVSRGPYPTAPVSHRPCAAPPTGPPLA